MFIFWLSVWFPLWYGREKSFKNQNFRPKKALETDLGSQGRRKNFEKNLMRDKKYGLWEVKWFHPLLKPLSHVLYKYLRKIYMNLIRVNWGKRSKIYFYWRRSLKEGGIPDICHGRHGHVRVNFFDRCKFLQI